jgi:hypothetical protein
MRLLDQVAQSNEPFLVEVPAQGRVFSLPGTDTIAADVQDCPLRYVLGDDVAETCSRLTYLDKQFITDCLDIVRMPAESIWVEWNERARRGAVEIPSESEMLRRAGFLVRADETGRRGSIFPCWTGSMPGSSELSPMRIDFDLDDPDFHRGCDADMLAMHNKSLSDPDIEPLRRIRYVVDSKWRSYYLTMTSSAELRGYLREAASAVAGDFTFLLGFSLLLAGRGAVRENVADLSRLNRSRERRGCPALLDHIELRAALFPAASDGSAAHYHAGKSAPRLHHVRGHLVRRGDAIFWRSAHLRGSADLGEIRSRTTTLRMGAG